MSLPVESVTDGEDDILQPELEPDSMSNLASSDHGRVASEKSGSDSSWLPRNVDAHSPTASAGHYTDIEYWFCF